MSNKEYLSEEINVDDQVLPHSTNVKRLPNILCRIKSGIFAGHIM